MVRDERVTPCELFNEAVEAFVQGDLPAAVTRARGGFFENLYIAPLLLQEEVHPQRIWHGSAGAGFDAAAEYVERYGRLWSARPEALRFLGAVWSDPLVRAELKSFLSLSRNLASARGEAQRDELLRERAMFSNPERLKRTQSEILERLSRTALAIPPPAPQLGLVMLASRDTDEAAAFYRALFEVEPVARSRSSVGYVEFEFAGIHLAIHGHDRPAAGDPYELGPPPQAFGWGALFVFRVAALERYLDNAVRNGIPLVDRDLDEPGRRYFVVKDPSGYLVEVTEEQPSGLETRPLT